MTAEEEEKLVQDEFQDLLNGYLASNHRKKVEIIERAFKFAKEAHKGIRRRSGEPYILHPIAVAKIASREIGLGSTSICAALLHDVVEDTDYTVEDIEQHFGKKIAQLVDGLTKISGGKFGDRASAQAENFRKLLLTMSEDIRVVLIKMADRLHNMRTLGSMAPNKQYKIAGETLYIYAPLAHRLGLYAIKTELEDLSFKYEHPAAYERITRQIEETEARRAAVYRDFASPITKRLTEMGIKFEARARLKSVYSIWRKMETKHIPFEEVYDLYAMRIIYDCDDPAMEKTICWNIYAALTDIYKLHPDRTRDWISVPKANGYQALHATLMGPDGNWVEVQIRSRRMDDIAEKGFAAHWRYKIGEGDEESELTVWLKTIKDVLDDPNPNALDFLDTLKLNLFANEIVVFTPSGELVTLPTNATVLDVAYHLHSELGNKCIAGKVNHRLVPLSHRLKSGDQVEVLTSQSQKPSPDWLKFLVTAKAKTRLRAALRRERQPVVERGEAIFKAYLERNGVAETNEVVTKLMGHYGMTNREELLYGLGSEEIELDDYLVKGMRAAAEPVVTPKRNPIKRLWPFGRSGRPADNAPDSPGITTPAKVNLKETYMLVDDHGHRNFIMRECCDPVPGDDVMGFLNDTGQVEVHKLDCPRAAALKAAYGPRVVATEWQKVSTSFRASIHMEGIDRRGMLREIAGAVSKMDNIDIRGLDISADNEVFQGNLSLQVTDTGIIDSVITKLLSIKGIVTATRVSI
ncbi:MAG: RelA/SpoT family protein [Candidatus Amulumruptor caecigallinarius]|nr:RelA/SpoT family protein [Candidatus Amulumruptor caecigallinarius]MCM1454702.1 RelA/SpoT family protein [bacterium]